MCRVSRPGKPMPLSTVSLSLSPSDSHRFASRALTFAGCLAVSQRPIYLVSKSPRPVLSPIGSSTVQCPRSFDTGELPRNAKALRSPTANAFCTTVRKGAESEETQQKAAQAENPSRRPKWQTALTRDTIYHAFLVPYLRNWISKRAHTATQGHTRANPHHRAPHPQSSEHSSTLFFAPPFIFLPLLTFTFPPFPPPALSSPLPSLFPLFVLFSPLAIVGANQISRADLHSSP